MTRILDVYLHEIKAGRLTQDEDGTLTFAYQNEYLDDGDRPAISVSMPLREEAYAHKIASSYFSGLLPDERARKRLASALGVSETNAFGLLEIIGGECAGALSLVPEGSPLPAPDEASPKPLTEKRLAEILDLLRSRPLLGGEKDVRLSLAGAQDKLAVRLVDGQVALSKEGQPTTHILKPFIEGLDGTVENEIFCMRLADRVGLSAPKVSRGAAGNVDYFLIERYDRLIGNDGTITRLHQEDFCQALSVPPELKYEEEGGPDIARCQNLIADHTARPAADRLAFLRMVIFHYLVGNADAHAKNYSLLYRENTPDLAPLYDVVCTAAYPNLAKKLAMQVGGRAIADTIQLKHWLTLVPDTRAAQRVLVKDLQEMAESVVTHADDLLAELYDEGLDHAILSHVREIIGTRAKLIERITKDQ